MLIYQFLKEFYTLFFVWLSTITAFIIYRRTWSFCFSLLAIFVIIYALLDTAGNIIAFKNINNHFYYNIVHTIVFIVVPYFFYCQLGEPFLKKIIPFYFIIFPLFVIIDILWIQDVLKFLTYSYVLGGSFIILLSVAYLWQLYTREETINIFRDPVFWFSLAYLFYFAVSVPYFGMLNYLWQNYPNFTSLYYLIIFDSTICLHNILLTVGFLCMKTTAK